jgi:uncharacterized protein YgbK (DUF1537 family)
VPEAGWNSGWRVIGQRVWAGANVGVYTRSPSVRRATGVHEGSVHAGRRRDSEVAHGDVTGFTAPGGEAVPVADLLRGQPPVVRHVGAGELGGLVLRSERRVLALDDDPTGSQTVRDVPIVMRWSAGDLAWAFRQPSPLAIVVTNSRSMSAQQAGGVAREVTAAAVAWGRARGNSGTPEVSLISRSDSTLRGHFPSEVDALMAAWTGQTGEGFDGLVFCPAYVEAGRITVGDVHWVVGGGMATPAGATEFARDAAFGYRSSDLKEWIDEKTSGRWKPAEIDAVSLEDIRIGGPNRVLEKLLGLSGGRPLVVNAADPADLDVVAWALVQAEQRGRRFMCRCGPSLLRARAGMPSRGALSSRELLGGGATGGTHGLIVVGSHVDLSSQQLGRVLALGDVSLVELEVMAALDEARRADEIARSADAVCSALGLQDVVLSTTRGVISGTDPNASLEISATVSAAVTEVVRQVRSRSPHLRFLIAKGGITSRDVLAEAMEFRRGWVIGQVLPGMVSAWMPARPAPSPGPEGSPMEAFPLIVFAGNVGEVDALADVLMLLRGGSQAGIP